MDGSDVFLLPLTAAEAHELFSRCLRSVEPDTAASECVLKKLAALLERGISEARTLAAA